MSLVSMLKGNGRSGFGYGSTAEDVTRDLDLSGSTILVTGINSGIGFETMRVLALHGARVVAAARTEEKAHEASGKVVGLTLPVACELTDPASIMACVDLLEAEGVVLDAVVCNAGIMAIPRLEQAFGYELQFFNNHIGHFILVTRLLDRLSEDARVVVVSSGAHRAAPKGGIGFDNLSGARGYRPSRAYGQSKLANLLFAKELARRFDGTARTANAVHPGVIHTNLGRSMPRAAQAGLAIVSPLALKSVGQGAATQCFVATRPDLMTSGAYFADCNIARSSSLSRDPDLARRLWEESERIAREVLPR
jgi:NAD(P)-dependent dehydrogenase (short-subunit alcohol dehydrogenase family)